MADLIININLDESRKKQGLIIETYGGVIPHLKSKQFSGQLRNVNLTSVSQADNLSLSELQIIKNIFNDAANTQISKYQYSFAVSQLPYLVPLVETGCIFCREQAKKPMYQVERLYINTDADSLLVFRDFSARQDSTVLYINYEIQKTEESSTEIIPLFYVDISTSEFKADLYFDYGSQIIKAESKEKHLENRNKYRNYKFEQDVISYVRKCHWKYCGKEYFRYDGKNIFEDLQELATHGIQLFTNRNQEIRAIDLTNVSVRYGIDWFDLKVDVKAGNEILSLNNIIDLCKKKENWIEYNGEILLIPEKLKNICKNAIQRNGENLIIKKNDIIGALDVIDYFSKKTITEYSSLEKYQSINLALPDNLMFILRDYQKVGVQWLLSLYKNGFGGCLADDMGLGKTLQIIAFLSDESQKNTTTLIVVPKTLIENWKREFAKFSPDISIYIYHGISRSLKEAQENRVIITTYGTLSNDIELFSDFRFDHLIIDEAQNIKNSRSKAYKSISLIKATTKIIITGTPLENNIQEYWGLMRIANPTKIAYKSIVAGLDDTQIVEKIKRLTRPFLLRRFKKDVLDDLPQKQEQIVYCNFDDSQKQLYINLLESIKQEIARKPDQFEIKSNSIILSGLLYLQEVCCHPRLLPKQYNVNHCVESAKTAQLMSMLSELYTSGHKTVVFSRFTKMLNIINKEALKKHFNVFYLDGSTGNRQRVVDEFEASKDGVFLISLKAGGVGLNLVSADTAIIYDPWWNPAIEKQAEDRIYRIGQKSKVTVYRLIAANTIEEKIRELQETKRRLFDDIVEGHDIPHNITMDDIRMLLDN